MNWGQRHTLAAGLALIAATNAVVLAGVAYNRSGEAEAQLRLTDRELSPPYSWGFAKENSGLAMQLKWSLPVAPSSRGDADDSPSASRWGAPGWLDRAKLIELGFDVARIERTDDERSPEPLPRDVFLVLEMDGAAHREALARAERRVAALQARAAADPQDSNARNALGWAGKALDDVRNKESRLFVVDAGLDPARLRAKYSDRTRYAIVGGRVSVSRAYGYKRRPASLTGSVEQLNVDEINVPVELRPAVGPDKAFEASVAFGRRLEPWFASAATRSR
jgi:hypothetical protein